MDYRSTFLFAVCILWAGTAEAQTAAERRVTADGNRFLLDGQPFDMWGIRVASATKDQNTTNHLIEQLDDYKAHGVNAVTVFYQGSSGGYYNPFSSDGLSIDEGHHSRMEQIIQACKSRGMVVIVGLFYQRASFKFTSATGVKNAVKTVAQKLKPYRNVIVNIANEQNSAGWDDSASIYDFRDPQRIIELCRVVHAEDEQRLVGGGGYDHAKNEIIGRSADVDILLFDTGGAASSSDVLYDRFVSAGVTGKPIVNVETFGAWTKQFMPPGVFPDSGKQEYFQEVDAGAARDGLYVFFHNNPWCQGPSMGDYPIRFDLAGRGTSSDPGIRWYFEYVKNSIGLTGGSNRSPVPSFVTPADGASYGEGVNLYVKVNAYDPDGSVSNVKLYRNDQLVRQENSAPYEWGAAEQNDPALQNMVAGTYRLRAVATDNLGAMASATITIAVTSATGPAVTSFTLINADSDGDIGPLVSGQTINLAGLPTRRLNVRANTSPATVGSVRFGYDGNGRYRTENSPPYALAGDSSGDYKPWTPSVGSHSLSATPYTQSSAGGTAGKPLTLTFSVVDGASAVASAVLSTDVEAAEGDRGQENKNACGMTGAEIVLLAILGAFVRRRTRVLS